MSITCSVSAFSQDRIRLSLDADWKFQRDPLPTRIKDALPIVWHWKPADHVSLKVDSLPPALDLDGWQSVKSGQDVFDGRPGYAWFQATLPSIRIDRTFVLRLDYADDNAAVFINGRRMAEHHGWNGSFDVPVFSAWRPNGPNIATVLVENTSGPGGLGAGRMLSMPNDVNLGPAQVTFPDRTWKTVHLPHDYVVEGSFSTEADNSHGSLPVVPAWYRKTFQLPTPGKQRSTWIDFEGVYRNSQVYLNGHLIGGRASGYIGFRCPIDRYANYGGKNVLAVRVDPREPEGWWYEGGGIYRHVWLTIANKVHFQPLSCSVRTSLRRAAHSQDDATVVVRRTIENQSGNGIHCVVIARVFDPAGHVASKENGQLYLPAHGSKEVVWKTNIHRPRLWSLESPELYRSETVIKQSARVTDSDSVTFGIRTIQFDPNLGLLLNGKRIKIKGTCNHQDMAGVGIAVSDSIQAWRISKLKEMGCNAYRCSHNPPSPALLDACDRLGMLVMDETRHLGDTSLSKTPDDTKATDLSEVRDMVRRDRNHPSVMMWSLANEEPIQGSPVGARLFAATAKVVKELDPTRPCTAAMNGGWLEDGISRVEDLIGVNYYVSSYDSIRAMYPRVPLFGSETASTYSTRGVYLNNPKAGQVSAYDVNAPGHGETAERAWKPIAERPWMAGSFVWTGFDYRGEPSPYGWPSVSSQFGILDSCGFPKDNYFYYKAWWGTQPVVHILPHWNWPEKVGQRVEVWVQSNAERVELILNGVSLGGHAVPRLSHVSWAVPYQPGTLVAKGYSGGRVVAEDKIETTGPAFSIELSSTRRCLVADGEDALPIEVRILDRQGRVVPTASSLIRFSIGRGGSVLGVGNGDPNCHEPDKATQRSAFMGKCLVVIGANRSGTIRLTASGKGLVSGELTLTSAASLSTKNLR